MRDAFALTIAVHVKVISARVGRHDDVIVGFENLYCAVGVQAIPRLR